MKTIRPSFWVEILAVTGGTALVLAVFFATIGAATSYSEPSSEAQAASPQAESARSEAQAQAAARPVSVSEQTYEGMVTDTRCGAKHSASIAENAADCTRVCIHAGEHFALVDGDRVYVLEGESQILKRAAGQRVTIAGTLNGDKLSVVSVKLPE